jgi:DNA-binding Xre family transcriptional regulator
MSGQKREVVWRLRELMAERGLFMTTEIVPLLKAQGIDLSREQVYRIATGVPQRLSLDLLGALCSILECTPDDLIQFKEVLKRRRAVGESLIDPKSLKDIRPLPTEVVRPDFLNKRGR